GTEEEYLLVPDQRDRGGRGRVADPSQRRLEAREGKHVRDRGGRALPIRHLREEAPVGQGAEVLYLRTVLDHAMGELDGRRRILRQPVRDILVSGAVRMVYAHVEGGGRVDERCRKVCQHRVPARGARYARRGGTHTVCLYPRR